MLAFSRRYLLGSSLLGLCAALGVVEVQAAPVSAKAPGTVPPIKQPTSMTCWATAATMLDSWKNNRSEGIETVLGAIGANYLTLFKSNEGLSGTSKPEFLRVMGLKAEVPQNYNADGWAKLITAYGPLWVTTNEGTDQNFSIHARILTAISGDGTANGTTMTVVDPADGQVHTETWFTFAQKFESIARGDGQDIRPQVVHY